MIPNADKIIEKAQRGEKPSTAERRHALSYLLVKEGGTDTNAAMGELFKVSERQIRLDKKWLREQRAAAIREDDPGLVIADIVMSFEKEVRELERGRVKTKAGSRTHLEYCKALFRMQLDKVKAMQDLGYLPKNLGNMSIQKFEYKALVGKDGSVDTRPVELIIDAEEIGPVSEQRQLSAPEDEQD